MLFCKHSKNFQRLIESYLIQKNCNFLELYSITMASKDENNLGKEESKASSSEKNDKSDSISIERIRQYLSEKLKFNTSESDEDGTDGRKVLDTVNIEGIIKHWKRGGFKNIVTMVGAGISTSAGIPDFRSPDSGLYHNLQKYNLPYPEAIFHMDFFNKNPQPFYKLAKELYPGNFLPTASHFFCKMLEDKGLLLRHYTQNIDTLERIAGISEEKLVEAHGSFFTNHCLECKKSYSMEWVKDEIFADRVPTCTKCNGVVKPDIVFFGEDLPKKFHELPNQDFKKCDLLIIMGTSLTVQPFAGLIDYVSDQCVRLLINRDKVGKPSSGFLRSMMFGEGLCFDLPGNRRDVAWEGDCDDGCLFLADQLGFGDELREIVKREHKKINKATTTDDSKASDILESTLKTIDDTDENVDRNLEQESLLNNESSKKVT